MPDTHIVDHTKVEVIGANRDEPKRITLRTPSGTLLRSYEPELSEDSTEKAEAGDQFVIDRTIHIIGGDRNQPAHLIVERLPAQGAHIADRSAPSDYEVESKPEPKGESKPKKAAKKEAKKDA